MDSVHAIGSWDSQVGVPEFRWVMLPMIHFPSMELTDLRVVTCVQLDPAFTFFVFRDRYLSAMLVLRVCTMVPIGLVSSLREQ